MDNWYHAIFDMGDQLGPCHFFPTKCSIFYRFMTINIGTTISIVTHPRSKFYANDIFHNK